MAKHHAPLEGATEDLGYKALRAGTLAVGKSTLPELGAATASTLAVASATLIGLADTAKSESYAPPIATLGAVSLLTGLSAGISQMDHAHRKRILLETYRSEIAAVVGKKPEAATLEDMARVAEGDLIGGVRANPGLKEALSHSASERNLSIALSSTASVGAYVVVDELLKKPFEGVGVIQLGEHLLNGHYAEAAADLAPVALKTATSLATYFAIKEPLHALVSKIFGLNKDTVNDLVNDIRHSHAHGEKITEEAVLGVYLAAQKGLDSQVTQAFGANFEELKPSQRQEVVHLLESELKLAQTTEDINLGRIKPEELLFLSAGQSSGVKRHETAEVAQPKEGMVAKLLHKLQGSNVKSDEPVAAATVSVKDQVPSAVTTLTLAMPDKHTAALRLDRNINLPNAKGSFVSMVGKKEMPDGISFTQRVEQSSSIIERF